MIQVEVDAGLRLRVARFEGVVDDDELLGTYGALMARMYEILRSDAPEQIRVFRERSEAERWLNARG